MPRTQSPYQGPTGPSQPYGMYSQDVSLARSASNATTSTIRPLERAYSGPGGPTQPYGMYSQNTVPEDDHEVAGMGPAMAGFPGIAQVPLLSQASSQAIRRLGPDGEDADDLIGPDGYTEQLPPYSRYANGIPPKADSGAASFINQPPPDFPHPGQQEMAFAGSSRAQAAPAEYYRPESREIVPGSPATVNPFDDSAATISSTTALSSLPGSEKGSFKERVRRKGNRRVCCGLLPCWTLIFVIVVLCAALFLGAIVGGIVAHHALQRHSQPSPYPQPQSVTSDPTTVVTTTFADATPVTATPTDLPALPTGAFTYMLSSPIAGRNTNSCLDSVHGSAWDCSTGAVLNIDVIMQGPHNPRLTIDFQMKPDPQAPSPPAPLIRYGAQPPRLPLQVDLDLMGDNNERDKGPAFFFPAALR